MRYSLACLALLVCAGLGSAFEPMLQGGDDDGWIFSRPAVHITSVKQGYDCGCAGQGGCVCGPGCACVPYLRSPPAPTQAPVQAPALTLQAASWQRDPWTGQLFRPGAVAQAPPIYYQAPPLFFGGGPVGWGGGACAGSS